MQHSPVEDDASPLRDEPEELINQGAAAGPTPDELPQPAHWLRWILRGLAIACVCLSAWLVLLGPKTEQCETLNKQVSTATSSTEERAQTCTTARPNVLQITPLVALAALLLIGELTEVSIPGLFTLKTRILEQSERQDRLENELIRVTSNQTQSVVQHYYPDTYQNPQAVSESARKKTDPQKSSGSLSNTRSSSSGPDLAGLKYQVIEAFEKIAPFVSIGQNVRRFRWDQLDRRMPQPYRHALERMSPVQLDSVMEWYKRFESEIHSVRAVRNSVAHPPALVTDVDLEATLETIETLIAELARRGLIDPEE